MNIGTLQHKGRPAEILLVEDNHGDALLTRKAFKHAKIASRITVAKNGEEAMQLLHRKGEHANAPMPDLILLDLNLPKKSGKDILKEIKSDPALRHIPVIVLTSSRAELDVAKTYDLHANSYIIKPVNLDQFSDIVSTIAHYWFSIVILTDEEEKL
jgi:CheY-like chemotaxis protein